MHLSSFPTESGRLQSPLERGFSKNTSTGAFPQEPGPEPFRWILPFINEVAALRLPTRKAVEKVTWSIIPDRGKAGLWPCRDSGELRNALHHVMFSYVLCLTSRIRSGGLLHRLLSDSKRNGTVTRQNANIELKETATKGEVTKKLK